MKVIVIGCTHAGTSAIINIAKMHKDAEITVYERNDTISFLSCGIALYVGGVVKDSNELFYSSPDALRKMGVNTRMQHDVVHVQVSNKKITVKNRFTGELFDDYYDKLILTTGSWPIQPNIEGIDLNNIVLSKNFDHSNIIIEKAKTSHKIVVIGAGYIGIELVEAFREQGKEVVLIDSFERVLSKYLDREFTDKVEMVLEEKGIRLALGQTVTCFDGKEGSVTKVHTDRGTYEADLVVLCIGFKPNTELVKGQVDMLENGAIIVNEYMETSAEGVFAAGDSCAIRYNPTNKTGYIPLATNAVRMGTLIARNIKTPTTKYLGTQGTSGIKVYELNISSTGLTEEVALQQGIEVQTSIVIDNDRPEFMPTFSEVTLKVVYEKEGKKILGAQIVSEQDMTQMMNTLSVCIQNKMTMEDIAFIDFFFQPHYNKPWSIINQAGLKTLN
jgi:NADPH-dependent 2,4-dienoyl-CoA reductase/sulfur reductase-like enzyme